MASHPVYPKGTPVVIITPRFEGEVIVDKRYPLGGDNPAYRGVDGQGVGRMFRASDVNCIRIPDGEEGKRIFEALFGL